MVLENAIKSAECTDLLLSDLQSLNKSGNAMVSLLVLPEIEKVAELKARLEAIVYAIKAE